MKLPEYICASKLGDEVECWSIEQGFGIVTAKRKNGEFERERRRRE